MLTGPAGGGTFGAGAVGHCRPQRTTALRTVIDLAPELDASALNMMVSDALARGLFSVEDAWDRLDFEALWALSGDELRDGMGRRDFVAAKRAAYQRQPELENLAAHVAVEHLDAGRHAAIVRTRVDVRGGGVTHNELQLAHRAGRWVVVAYHLLGPDDSRDLLAR